MRHLLAVITVLLCQLTMASGAQVQFSGELDVGESMVLMRNLLKDLRRTADIDQQYSMLLRTRETLDEIAASLPRREHDEWVDEIVIAPFHAMRVKDQVIAHPDGIETQRFRLLRSLDHLVLVALGAEVGQQNAIFSSH